MTISIGRVVLPEGCPTIGLEVRVLDGVPVIFTTDGCFVRGQQSLDVRAALDEVTTATLRVHVETPAEKI